MRPAKNTPKQPPVPVYCVLSIRDLRGMIEDIETHGSKQGDVSTGVFRSTAYPIKGGGTSLQVESHEFRTSYGNLYKTKP